MKTPRAAASSSHSVGPKPLSAQRRSAASEATAAASAPPLAGTSAIVTRSGLARVQGLTLVHFSAQRKRFL